MLETEEEAYIDEVIIERFFSSHKLPSEVMFLMTFTSRSLNFDIFQMPGYPFDVYCEHSNRCVRK